MKKGKILRKMSWTNIAIQIELIKLDEASKEERISWQIKTISSKIKWSFLKKSNKKKG